MLHNRNIKLNVHYALEVSFLTSIMNENRLLRFLFVRQNYFFVHKVNRNFSLMPIYLTTASSGFKLRVSKAPLSTQKHKNM